MKKKSPPFALIGAVVLGFVAIYFLYQNHQAEAKRIADAAAAATAAMQSKLDAANSRPTISVPETQTNMRNVLYATQPVVAGVRITPAFFEKKLTPKDILPDAYTDQADVVQLYATRNIEKGDPLTPRNVGPTPPHMSERIGLGMRAIALKVFNGGDTNDTGGFVVDGDKVDLLFTHLTLDNQFIINTKLVLQNLNVLYVPGPTIKTDKTEGITPVPTPGDSMAVTFEVTPEQAQALVYMSHIKNGYFSMILRARKDTSEIKIKAFAGSDYNGDYAKVQRMGDKSIERVQNLAKEIEAQEKTDSSQPKPNETTPPTPPSP